MRVKCSCCGEPITITTGERRLNKTFSERYGTCSNCGSKHKVLTETVVITEPSKSLTSQQKNWCNA